MIDFDSLYNFSIEGMDHLIGGLIRKYGPTINDRVIYQSNDPDIQEAQRRVEIANGIAQNAIDKLTTDPIVYNIEIDSPHSYLYVSKEPFPFAVMPAISPAHEKELAKDGLARVQERYPFIYEALFFVGLTEEVGALT